MNAVKPQNWLPLIMIEICVGNFEGDLFIYLRFVITRPSQTNIVMHILSPSMIWQKRRMTMCESLLNSEISSYLFHEPKPNQSEAEYRQEFYDKYIKLNMRYDYNTV